MALFSTATATVLRGDCLERLRELPDESIDAIVTDPPYGLSATKPKQVNETIARWLAGERDYLPRGRGFVGAEWDSFVPPPAVWDECMRVLKPGGHLLAFAGSRTQDLMGLGVRLAGFEIRDSVAWIYAGGFPKSQDVGKLIDRSNGENRARQLQFTAWMRSTGVTAKQINEATGSFMGPHYLTDLSQPAIATADMFDKMRPLLPDVPEEIERLVAERTGIEWTDYVKRPQVGVASVNGGVGFGVTYGRDSSRVEVPVTVAATDQSAKWSGWGTALRPAHEPVIVARKPLAGTVAYNVLNHGTGAYNIDGCRLPEARFPGNVALDEASADELGDRSRFFYAPKAHRSERPVVDGVSHPTVKPLALMRWLVRLVTPAGGVVLDPFAGSGTTVEAAIAEGFNAVGIEREPEFVELIRARLDRVHPGASAAA